MKINSLRIIIACVTLVLLSSVIVAYNTYDYETAAYLSIIIFINLLLLVGMGQLNSNKDDFSFVVIIEQKWEKSSPYVAYSYKSRSAAEKRAKEERAMSVNTKAEVMMYESRVMDW